MTHNEVLVIDQIIEFEFRSFYPDEMYVR